MKGDFSRDTFDPKKHYSGVWQQQGRVQLDADSNEQTAIVLHHLRALARDLIGPHGGSGFAIVTKEGDVENLRDASGHRLDDNRKVILRQAIKDGDFVIGAGHYYVDGILVENETPITYTEQIGYPFDDHTSRDAVSAWRSNLAIYLDVWERHITYVEDEAIREVALGGSDTATRSKIVWQVKVLLQSEAGHLTCSSIDTHLMPIGSGRLRARAGLDEPQTQPCDTSGPARFQGAKNQLYRVEIHNGGALQPGRKAPTFKWSRENGSVIFPAVRIAAATSSRTQVVVTSLGLDERLGLRIGDWVEVIDDEYVLQNRSDPLLQVAAIEERIVTLDGTTQVADAGQHKLLRRWDQQGDAMLGGAVPVVADDDADVSKEAWISLEAGVQIRFAKEGEYQTGDYWLLPARVGTGDVDWPRELDGSGKLVAAPMPARGLRHYYAPLAVRTATGEFKSCRRTIKQITNSPDA